MVWQFLKPLKYTIALWLSSSTSGNTAQRTESRDSNRYLYLNAYNGIICISQTIKTTQMSTDRCMDKQNVVYT